MNVNDLEDITLTFDDGIWYTDDDYLIEENITVASPTKTFDVYFDTLCSCTSLGEVSTLNAAIDIITAHRARARENS